MSMEIAFPPAGFRPPPGLELECYSDDNTMFPTQNAPLVSSCSLGTRLSSKAIPFQPKFDTIGMQSSTPGCDFSGNTWHSQNKLGDCPVPEVVKLSDNLAIDVQQTLGGLKGALAGCVAGTPSNNEQDVQVDASVQQLQETLVQLKGSLAGWKPSRPKGHKQDMKVDKSVQQLQQTLVQLKGALEGWEPSTPKSNDQDGCSTKSGSSRSSSKSGSTKSSSTKSSSTKSSSTKSSRSKASAKSSKIKRSTSKNRGSEAHFDAFAAGAVDVNKQIMNTYVYQPELAPSPAMMWGAPWTSDPQVAWQGGYPTIEPSSWAFQQLPKPVSIDSSLNKDAKDNTYDLKRIDPSFILNVRKIYNLGLESSSWLKAYFSKWGIVDKVLVSNSRSRATSPGCFGFVVMSTAADVQAILQAGSVHVINGVSVTVQPYKRRDDADSEDKDVTQADMRFQ